MQYGLIDEEQFSYLLNTNKIRFENIGLKEVWNIFSRFDEETIKKTIEDNDINESNVFKRPIKENVDYEYLTEEEKINYKKYWLSRLCFFYDKDFTWDKNDFNSLNILNIKNEVINENGFIENLSHLIKEGIYVNIDFREKAHLFFDKEKITIDESDIDKYDVEEYSLPKVDISLISKERDINYYKKWLEEGDFNLRVSLIKDISQMQDVEFMQFIVDMYVQKKSDDLQKEYIKVVQMYGQNDIINLTVSEEENLKNYKKIFGIDIRYDDIKEKSDILENILNDFYVRLYSLYLEHAQENNNSKSHIDFISRTLATPVFLPKLSFNIEPLFHDYVKNKNGKYTYCNSCTIETEGDKVSIFYDNKYAKFKKLIINEVKNIIHEHSAIKEADEMNLSYNRNNNDQILSFVVMMEIMRQYHPNIKMNDDVIIAYEKFKINILNNESQEIVDYFNILPLVNAEQVTQLNKKTLKENIIYSILKKNRVSYLLTKLCQPKITSLKQLSCNISLPNISVETLEKNSNIANNIFNIITSDDFLDIKNIQNLFNIGEESANDLLINAYENMLNEDLEWSEYINFNNIEDVNNFLEKMKFLKSKNIQEYKLKEIYSNVSSNILNIYLKENVDIEKINMLINQHHNRDMENTDINKIFDYFIAKNIIKINDSKMFNFYKLNYSNLEYEILVQDIVKIQGEPLLDIVDNKLKPQFSYLFKKISVDQNLSNEDKIKLLGLGVDYELISYDDMQEIINKSNISIKELMIRYGFKNLEKFKYREINGQFLKKLSSEYRNQIFEILSNSIAQSKIYLDDKTVRYISSLDLLEQQKEDILVNILSNSKNLHSHIIFDFDIKSFKCEALTINNKRLFKKILHNFNLSLQKDYMFEENRLNKTELSKEQDFKLFISSKIKILISIGEFFTPALKEDMLWVTTISNFSKKYATDINQMNFFNDMKKLFNKLYLLLPENIANKAIDKLNDGKLLHVFLNEINIVEEISKEKQTNNQRTRLKI